MTQTGEEPAGGVPSGSSENVATNALGLTSDDSRSPGPRQAVAAADPWPLSAWRTAIAYLASTGQPFTSDDCHALGAPMPDRPNAVGGLFLAARASGQIQPVGYAPSRRGSRRNGVQRLWIGAHVR